MKAICIFFQVTDIYEGAEDLCEFLKCTRWRSACNSYAHTGQVVKSIL
jgi:hypothetical protein